MVTPTSISPLNGLTNPTSPRTYSIASPDRAIWCWDEYEPIACGAVALRAIHSGQVCIERRLTEEHEHVTDRRGCHHEDFQERHAFNRQLEEGYI
jgi:hypothetical protein